MVLAGLPVGMHLQERFLHESVKALVVLTERIRTRLTQGAGRTTRNTADYAAVLMLGRDLANFCAQPGVQAASHPEIRAELCFGLDNSTGMPSRDAMHNLRHFSTRTRTGAPPSRTSSPRARRWPAPPARHRAARRRRATRGRRSGRRRARRLAGRDRRGRESADPPGR